MGASLEQSARNLQVLSQFSKTLAGAVKPILDINAEETKQDELLEQYKEDISKITGAFPDADQDNIKAILDKQQKVLEDKGIYKVYENAARLDENDKLRSAMRAQALQTRMSGRLEEASQVNNPTAVGDIAAEEAQGLQGSIVGQDAFGQEVRFEVDENMSIAELIAFTHQKAGVVAGFQQAAEKEREKKALEGNQRIAGANVYQQLQEFGKGEFDASSMKDTFQKLFEGFRNLNVQNPDGVFFEALESYLADKLRDPATTVNDVRNIREMMDAIPDIVKFKDSNGVDIHLAKEGTANYNKLLDLDAKFERGWGDVQEARYEAQQAQNDAKVKAILLEATEEAKTRQEQLQRPLTQREIDIIKRKAADALEGVTIDLDKELGKIDTVLDLWTSNNATDNAVYFDFVQRIDGGGQVTEQELLEAAQQGLLSRSDYDELKARRSNNLSNQREQRYGRDGASVLKLDAGDTTRAATDHLKVNDITVPTFATDPETGEIIYQVVQGQRVPTVIGQVHMGREDNTLPPEESVQLENTTREVDLVLDNGGTIQSKAADLSSLQAPTDEKSAERYGKFVSELLRLGLTNEEIRSLTAHASQPLTLPPLEAGADLTAITEQRAKAQRWLAMEAKAVATLYMLRRRQAVTTVKEVYGQ
jgi:hypothetical protein